ncbi:MT-A70 family methyltransferase [Paracoccus sp. (in: a-proteobacteria)]|uniref:MT-A70 family methyltransferase n=1 Tax=Paracoccus sp. TaxID=267 RepID=UPI0026DF0FE8|nr:MT-A70 family methyltransferase [Paracoccus sp. (in: a-proteobacteria)]MDO5648732.1 MT-A70 family methyltransferase [Paracoccus sp. (in: a-proteobacteria)]
MSGWPFAHLTPMKYGVILADPPWSYQMRSVNGHDKSPEAHYATMSHDDLCALPVGHLAGPDCMLFLWSTWPHLPQAMALMTAWGFTYVTGGSWTKRTKAWNVAMGTGYVLRSATEPFLLGKIGAPRARSRSVRGLINAPIPDLIEGVRREHSRKPPEMRAMIDDLFPDVWGCELFAREPWPGRDVWGNQTDLFSEAS